MSEGGVPINSQQSQKQAYQKSQKTHRSHQKTKIRGVAIVLAFLLVPMLFVLLYINSDRLPKDESAAVYTNSDALATDDGTQSVDSQEVGEVLGSVSSFDLNEPDTAGQENTDQPGNEITGTAYLTFDDGPDRVITPAILDILLEEDVKATFFVLPNEGVDDIFMRIIDEGHELGNHSFSHDYPVLYESSPGAFKEDILKAQWFVLDNFGYTTTSFRFPGGSMSWPNVIRSRIDIINELGYRHYDWFVDPEDWRVGSTVDSIINETLEQTKALGKEHVIVLLHDYRNRDLTVEALPGIIRGLRDMGYDFDIVRNYPADQRTGYGSKS